MRQPKPAQPRVSHSPTHPLADDIRPGQSLELLKELHILTREGRLNQDSRRKLKQVYHLFQFIEKLLLSLGDGAPASAAGSVAELVFSTAEPFRAVMGEGKDHELWPVYDAIRCPTRVLRGETSDVLTRETAQEMTRRGPHAELVEIPGVGHAPMLLDEAQIRHVREFLLAS